MSLVKASPKVIKYASINDKIKDIVPPTFKIPKVLSKELTDIDIEIAVQDKMEEIRKKRLEDTIQKEAEKRLDYLSAKTIEELRKFILIHEKEYIENECIKRNLIGVNMHHQTVKNNKYIIDAIQKDIIKKGLVSQECLDDLSKIEFQQLINNIFSERDIDSIKMFIIQGNQDVIAKLEQYNSYNKEPIIID